MGWSSPRTWNVGEIVTKALMDLHIRDNLNYLKGVNQVPTIESGLIIDNTGGDEYLKLPLLSTAETGTVLAAEGKIAFDEQTHQVKIHNGTAVKAVISEADVDDTPVNGADTVPISSNWAYDFINTLTTEGDIAYATAAGVWARLGKGTAGYYLKQGAAVPEWAAGVYLSSSGTYTGNSSANRAIPHGLAVIPTVVLCYSTGSGYGRLFESNPTIWFYLSDSATSAGAAVTTMDTTNFYVGNAASYVYTMNLNGQAYKWVAIG